jgi:hypothetical protein
MINRLRRSVPTEVSPYQYRSGNEVDLEFWRIATKMPEERRIATELIAATESKPMELTSLTPEWAYWKAQNAANFIVDRLVFRNH